MAKPDLKKIRSDAKTKYPGDRVMQAAWIEIMTAAPAPSTPRKRASTAKKTAAKVVKPVAKRRRTF